MVVATCDERRCPSPPWKNTRLLDILLGPGKAGAVPSCISHCHRPDPRHPARRRGHPPLTSQLLVLPSHHRPSSWNKSSSSTRSEGNGGGLQIVSEEAGPQVGARREVLPRIARVSVETLLRAMLGSGQGRRSLLAHSDATEAKASLSLSLRKHNVPMAVIHASRAWQWPGPFPPGALPSSGGCPALHCNG